MQKAIDKELIRKRFQKSLVTYTQHASVQKEMAEKLISYISSNVGTSFDNIFEIGCGTGNLTCNIIQSLKYKSFTANDIVSDARDHVNSLSSDINFLPGDVESICLPLNLDIIVSNATLQWITNVPEFLKKLSFCLNSKGVLAFTYFSSANFAEISAITGCKLNYHSKDVFFSVLKDIMDPVFYTDEVITLEFNDPIEVLTHIKQIGVNSLNQGFWTRKRLNEFRINYIRHFSIGDKVKLTYCPEYYIFKVK